MYKEKKVEEEERGSKGGKMAEMQQKIIPGSRNSARAGVQR